MWGSYVAYLDRLERQCDEAYTEGRRQTYLDLIKANLRIADDLDALPDQRLLAEWHRTQAARFANRLRQLDAAGSSDVQEPTP